MNLGRIDEDLARDAFRRFLADLGTTKQRWRRGPEPPDFYLWADGQSYAVEVTRVMDSHQVGAIVATTQGVRSALTALTRAMQKEGERRGLLSGYYVLRLVPIADLKRRQSEIVERALQYMHDTQASPEAPEADLGVATMTRRITIRKIHARANRVEAGISIGPLKRDHTIVDDLRRLIGDALDSKRSKLLRTKLPRILLLFDSYIYGEANHWSEAAAALSFDGYHTVARTSDWCQLLHSVDDRWSTAV